MVVINTKTYNYVVDVTFQHLNQESLPNWLNQAEALDSSIWTKNVQKMVYVIKATDTEKWQLDKDLRAHKYVTLIDTIDATRKYFLVWINSISSNYIGKENSKYPWEIEIETVAIGETRNYIGFELNVFADEYERIFYE